MTIATLQAVASPMASAAGTLAGWDLTVESGYLWGLRINTANDYEMAPAQLTLRSPATITLWEGNDGARWIVRTRLSLMVAAFTRGPEDFYTAVLAAPSIEREFAGGATAWFFSLGGGAGITNSSGGNDGLGHDLSLNWFAQGGLRQRISESLDWQASVFFLHLSNGGRTTPNPAVDALGFSVGFTRRF